MILPPWAVFHYLSPSLRRFCPYDISTRTVNKTSWSNPRQTRICYSFRLWVIINALLKKISLYLLSHFRIRIIVLTCPDNKSARNQPKSRVPAMQNLTNHNDARPILFQLKSSLPFSLFLFVWRLVSTTTKIRRFAVGPVYPSKSLSMCSSNFVFRKYKQDSAFRVSGVLQLAKTGPPVTKNFPLRRLFPSDVIMAWRFYTPYDVNVLICIFWPRTECRTFLLELVNFEAREKIRAPLSEAQTRKLRIRGS